MTRIVAVASGKGGVGKTTTVSNLGAALSGLGKDVIIVDGNLTTPNLSLHLGIPLYPITIHDVLKGKSDITESIYIHPTGLRVIPASLSIDDLEGVSPKYMSQIIRSLSGNAEFILLDCSAGLGKETMATLEAADELVIVTEPDLPSVTDALKTKKIAEMMGIEIAGVILNKTRNLKRELSQKEVEGMLEVPVLQSIPYDVSVPKSISVKNPVVHYRPLSPPSLAFKKLACKLTGEEFKENESGFFNKILNWLRG